MVERTRSQSESGIARLQETTSTAASSGFSTLVLQHRQELQKKNLWVIFIPCVWGRGRCTQTCPLVGPGLSSSLHVLHPCPWSWLWLPRCPRACGFGLPWYQFWPPLYRNPLSPNYRANMPAHSTANFDRDTNFPLIELLWGLNANLFIVAIIGPGTYLVCLP